MAKTSVWIKNNVGYPVTFGDITFPIYKVDGGEVLATGYTQIEDDKFKKLLEVPMFASLVKAGTLVRHVKAPAGALLSTELIDSLRDEIALKDAKIAELEAVLTGAKPAKGKKGVPAGETAEGETAEGETAEGEL